MTSDLERLSVHYRTTFLITDSGRIERENDPDQSPGPKLWLAGCASGNAFGVRADLPEPSADELLALAATEPPLDALGARPRHLERYLELLSQGDARPKPSFGLLYALPHCTAFEHAATLVDSESEEGERLYAALARGGLPQGLLALGFREVSEFWAPWCAVLHEGEVVALAFAARLSEIGADLGVATSAASRGKGYAAAATAGWSALPSLRSRELFYGTNQTNLSSQRVTERLGLRFLGANLRIG